MADYQFQIFLGLFILVLDIGPLFGSSNLLLIYYPPGSKSEALQLGVHLIHLDFIIISLNMISFLKIKIKRNFEKIIRERYVIESTAGTII